MFGDVRLVNFAALRAGSPAPKNLPHCCRRVRDVILYSKVEAASINGSSLMASGDPFQSSVMARSSIVRLGTRQRRARLSLACHSLGRGAAMSEPAIKLNDVTVAYARHPAVHHVSGSFERGSITAIAGPNGAGKSTLLKAIMGELRLAEGSIDRGGLAISDFGYLPQAAEIDRQFPMTVADTVMLGTWRQSGAFRGVQPAAAVRARETLMAVGTRWVWIPPDRISFSGSIPASTFCKAVDAGREGHRLG